jgi:hypothetical protein
MFNRGWQGGGLDPTLDAVARREVVTEVWEAMSTTCCGFNADGIAAALDRLFGEPGSVIAVHAHYFAEGVLAEGLAPLDGFATQIKELGITARVWGFDTNQIGSLCAGFAIAATTLADDMAEP